MISLTSTTRPAFLVKKENTSRSSALRGSPVTKTVLMSRSRAASSRSAARAARTSGGVRELWRFRGGRGREVERLMLLLSLLSFSLSFFSPTHRARLLRRERSPRGERDLDLLERRRERSLEREKRRGRRACFGAAVARASATACCLSLELGEPVVFWSLVSVERGMRVSERKRERHWSLFLVKFGDPKKKRSRKTHSSSSAIF